MPFELAPFFFHARGEVMMATIALNLLYPFAAIMFILGYHSLINGESLRRDNGRS